MMPETNGLLRAEFGLPQVLVTGGAGFVGSHLCDYFLSRGYGVTCVDSLLTGSLENVQHLVPEPRFHFLRHDVTVPFEPDVPPDLVLHFASTASPKDYYRYPIETLQAGSAGTHNALEVARAHRARFVLASSSEVYGDPQVNPQPECYWGNVNPIGSRSVYDEAKRYAEAVSMAYAREYGLDVRIARIFNTYGHRMRLDDGRVLPNFFVQALRDESLTVYGDGSQTRSLCYIDDLVRGIYALATYSPLSSDHEQPLVFNLGNPEEARVLDIALEVIQLTRSRSRIAFSPLPEDDPKVRRPDIARAISALGWKPRVSRKQGLRLIATYFRSAMRRGIAFSAG